MGKVLYGLSEDKEFSEFGGVSRIPYREHYEAYVKLLREGLAKKTKDVLDLFAEWNKFLFPRGAAARGLSDNGDDMGQAEALAMLDKGSDHSEDPNEE